MFSRDGTFSPTEKFSKILKSETNKQQQHHKTTLVHLNYKETISATNNEAPQTQIKP